MKNRNGGDISRLDAIQTITFEVHGGCTVQDGAEAAEDLRRMLPGVYEIKFIHNDRTYKSRLATDEVIIVPKVKP